MQIPPLYMMMTLGPLIGLLALPAKKRWRSRVRGVDDVDDDDDVRGGNVPRAPLHEVERDDLNG